VTALSLRDYDRMLELAHDILASSNPENAWELVGQHLNDRLIGGDASMYGAIGRTGRGAEFTHVYPHDVIRLPPPTPAGYPIPMDAYTTGRYCDAAEAVKAIRATDWIPSPQWRRTPSYAELREFFGIRNVLVLPLAPGETSDRAMLLARSAGDFPDRHVEIAERVQPLLTAVDRHLHHLNRWRAATLARAVAPATEQALAEVKLTSRELVVLTLLADGLTAIAIAHRLGISARTVGKHQENLYRKLNASDRLAAVLHAQRLGLLPPPRSAARESTNESVTAADGSAVSSLALAVESPASVLVEAGSTYAGVPSPIPAL
jgi:DNA-binding CsgD family transcriptional regulator